MTAQLGSRVGGLKRMVFEILAGWLFLAVYLATDNIYLATLLGLATGLGQAIWMISRRQKVDPIQWMILALIVGLGSATILTHNPTYIVFKPSIFEACIGFMMLRPGWLVRYVPSCARDLVPRLLLLWGYLWAAAWFALAASSLLVVRTYGLKAWAVYTQFSPWALVGVLMGLGYLVFPPIVRRAAQALEATRSSQPSAAEAPPRRQPGRDSLV